MCVADGDAFLLAVAVQASTFREDSCSLWEAVWGVPSSSPQFYSAEMARDEEFVPISVYARVALRMCGDRYPPSAAVAVERRGRLAQVVGVLACWVSFTIEAPGPTRVRMLGRGWSEADGASVYDIDERGGEDPRPFALQVCAGSPLGCTVP